MDGNSCSKGVSFSLPSCFVSSIQLAMLRSAEFVIVTGIIQSMLVVILTGCVVEGRTLVCTRKGEHRCLYMDQALQKLHHHLIRVLVHLMIEIFQSVEPTEDSWLLWLTLFPHSSPISCESFLRFARQVGLRHASGQAPNIVLQR